MNKTTKQLLLAAGALFLAASPQALAGVPEGRVTGFVRNELGEPLPGVSVTLEGTQRHAQTDIHGAFSLLNVTNGARLRFSYIGYESKEVAASDTVRVELKEKDAQLGEAVVTTQKRYQTAIEVPITVSALSGASLDKMQIKGIDEMSEFVPGLQVQVQSPNNPGYVIRGVTSDEGESYSQPRISVFTDGVSTSRSRASVAELFDMERIEVVKGPQGTLFGRGAEIGAIHFLRHRPVSYLTGEFALNYGTHNQRGAQGMINTPFGQHVANRFAFSYDAHDGFIKNTEGGRLNGKNTLALRNSTRFNFGERTTADLVLDYQYDDAPGTSFKGKRFPAIGGDNSPFTTASLNGGKDLGITRHVGGATFLLDHTLNQALKLSSITAFRAFKSHESFDADGTYLPLLDCQENERGTQFSQELRLNYDAGGRFSGFLGASYFYENSRQESIVKTDLSYLYPAYLGGVFAQKVKPAVTPAITALQSGVDGLAAKLGGVIGAGAASQLLTPLKNALGTLESKWFPAQSNPASPVTATPDFYGDLEKTFQGFLAQAAQNPMMAAYLKMMGLTPSSSLSDILTAIGAPQAQVAQLAQLKAVSGVQLGSQEEESTNYGINQAAEVFADGTLHLYKGLSLTAGLRGTYEHQKTGYSSTTVPHPLFGAIQFQPTKNGSRVWMSDNYLSWVGRVALNYLFGRNNAYISVARGRRPGVLYFNNDPEKQVHLKPEIIVSYEAGIKGSVMEGKLGYEAAVYYYDWSHFQTSRLDPNYNPASGTLRSYVADDAGKAHSLGLELGMRYTPCRYFSFFANYAYIDGKFNNKDKYGVEQEYAGHRFRLTPKHTFSLGADATIPVKDKASIYLRPSYSWKSQVFFEDDNDPALTQDAYGLLNFTAGVRFKTGKVHYDFSLFGKNALNEKYLIDAGNTGNQIGFPTYVAGPMSIYGVQVKLSF